MGIWIGTFAITAVVLVSFAWGSVCYLRLRKEPNLWKRLMAVSVYLWLAVDGVAIACFISPRPPVAWLSVAVLLFLLALWFFWGAVWAHKSNRPAFAFSKEPPAWFAWRGPYRYVRHPIYTSYLLAFAGAA